MPPEQGESLKQAHRAWVRFQEIAGQIAADNRERFLGTLRRAKQIAKPERAKARAKA